jgi:hypothetical protein
MKKYRNIILFVVFLAISGCKKEEASRQIDVKTLFNGTTWTGEFKYNSRPVYEPFAIDFTGQGNFTWHELDGDFTGVYSVNSSTGEVVITFDGSSRNVTATVASGDTFSFIRYGGAYPWVIKEARLNTIINQPLENTFWKGYVSPSNDILELAVLPGNLVKFGNSPPRIYTRNGVVLKVKDLDPRSNKVPFFLVLQAGNRLSGIGDFRPLFEGYQLFRL